MGFKKWTASEDQLRPDPKYGNRLASKFINCMMWQGKKSTAQRIFYGAMDIAKKKLTEVESLELFEKAIENIKDASPIEVFERAVDNVKPEIQIRSRRVGGSNYQVPMPVNARRKQSLAIRWILEAARAKKGRPMEERLSSELIDAFNRTGAAYSTRENVHRQADANKAFAHFAW